jgi:hypothetical protein
LPLHSYPQHPADGERHEQTDKRNSHRKEKECKRDAQDGERDGEDPSRQAARNQLNLNYFLDVNHFLAGHFPILQPFFMRIQRPEIDMKCSA